VCPHRICNVVISPVIRYGACAAQVYSAVRLYLPSGIANAFTTEASNFSIPISVITTSILVAICSAMWRYALRPSIWKEKYGSGIALFGEVCIPLQIEHTYTHHTLCYRIATLTFYIFNKF